MDTDVTRFLHVFGIRDHSIGIWNREPSAETFFTFLPEILAIFW